MSEQAFNAAKSVASMSGAFFNTVAQEVGLEKALALLTKSNEGLGSMMGKMMKEQMGIIELDAKTISSMNKEMGGGLGFSPVIEESPTTVLVKNYKCPFYEGLQEVGFDHEGIEAFCRNGPAVMMKALFGQLDPNVSYRLKKFRSSPDDVCEEEFVLKK